MALIRSIRALVALPWRLVALVGTRRAGLLGAGFAAGLALAPVPGRQLRQRLAGLAARTVPDPDLARRVAAELAAGARTWHLPQPEVSALRGRVTLTGTAPHAGARADLVRAAQRVPGVSGVDDQIVLPAS